MTIRISRRAFLGAAPCAFAHATMTAAANYQPDTNVLPMLGDIANAIGTATPIGGSFVHRPRFLGLLPADQGGKRALLLDCALELDTDGWPGDSKNPNWQPETSLKYRDGHSLDANRVPYFVLPLPKSWPAQFGIALGDYAAVLFEGRMAFGVFGDQGLRSKIGEGSVELLRRLGQERIRPNGSVILAGTSPGVVTIVFPGSGSAADQENEATLLAAVERNGLARFVALGGRPPK